MLRSALYLAFKDFSEFIMNSHMIVTASISVSSSPLEINSNIAITKVIRDTLKECGITEDAVLLIEDTDRSVTTQFMKMNDYVDVLIPRGSAGLIRAVVDWYTIRCKCIK